MGLLPMPDNEYDETRGKHPKQIAGWLSTGVQQMLIFFLRQKSRNIDKHYYEKTSLEYKPTEASQVMLNVLAVSIV